MEGILKNIDRRIGPGLFYGALVLCLLSVFPLWSYDIPPVLKHIGRWTTYTGALLCLIRLVLMVAERPKYVLLCVVCGLVILISVQNGGREYLIYGFLLVVCSRDCDIKVILRIYLGYFVFMLLAAPLTWQLGWTANITKHKMGLQGNSWGFSNPNILAYFLAMLSLTVCTIFRKCRERIPLFVICWTMAAVTFFLTLSLTLTIALLAFPLIYLLIERLRPAPALMACLAVACLTLSVLLALCFGPGEGNTTFESRFSIPYLFYQTHGLSWMGNDNGTVYLDNFFLALALRDGIIPGIIILAFFSHYFYRLAKMGQPFVLALAVCVFLTGFMEEYPLLYLVNFPLLFYFQAEDELKLPSWNNMLLALGAFAAVVAIHLYSPWLPSFQKHNNAEHIGDIRLPEGFQRVECPADSYAAFLRNLPLEPETEGVVSFEGPEVSDTIQGYCHRVVNVPLLSEYEQCADVCIHLRADYLFGRREFRQIHFEDTQHNTMRYSPLKGGSRQAFRRYLIYVFGLANTESLRNEMSRREDLDGIQPGDVWCYDADSRENARYGHAMTVADVAVNPETGETLFMLVQGSTPACSIHILENLAEPELSPWFRLDGKAQIIDLGFAKYHRDELYSFE